MCVHVSACVCVSVYIFAHKPGCVCVCAGGYVSLPRGQPVCHLPPQADMTGRCGGSISLRFLRPRLAAVL